MHVTPMHLFGTAPPPVTMPRGRVCAESGCATRLSIYNPEPFCALHAGDDEAAIPETYCRCRNCGRVLPHTAAFFHRDRKAAPPGLRNLCKECRNGRNRDYQIQRDVVRKETKRCPHCGRARPLTLRWWYQQKWGAGVGRWSSWCIPCHRERHRQDARAARAKKKAAP